MLWQGISCNSVLHLFLTFLWKYHNLGARMLQHDKSDLDFSERNKKRKRKLDLVFIYSLDLYIVIYAHSSVYGAKLLIAIRTLVHPQIIFSCHFGYFSPRCGSCKLIIHEDETTKLAVYFLEALELTNHSNMGIVSNKLVSFSLPIPWYVLCFS
jgi:hypothetical protein